MFSKHHTWLVNQGSGSQEMYTIQQDDPRSVAGANIYLPGKPRFGVRPWLLAHIACNDNLDCDRGSQ